jgi:DHA1 family bicyclomycin/chloramphenicol resistance-like MFS transporter
VYAAALLGLYVVLVPETRQGKWGNLSMRSLFAQCREVATRRVDGRHLPIRYAIAMAFSTSVLMIFVTNASFIYMEYFGVEPRSFPLLFGLSVVGFMSMNLFSMKKLHSHNAARFFRTGLTIQIVAVLGLLGVVVTDSASLWTIVPLIVVMMSTLGLVGPAGSARYMGFFQQLAGSASSVYTTMMFLFGGVLGAVTGLFYDGSLLPVVGMMVLASITASSIGWALPTRASARTS